MYIFNIYPVNLSRNPLTFPRILPIIEKEVEEHFASDFFLCASKSNLSKWRGFYDTK